MEVISDYVKFAYKSVEAAVDEEWDRDSVVERVEASVSSLSKLIDYNSSIWSFTIVKVGPNVLGPFFGSVLIRPLHVSKWAEKLCSEQPQMIRLLQYLWDRTVKL